MWEILWVFLQATVGRILPLALRLESGQFPRPLAPERERATFAALRAGGAGAGDARDCLIRHNLRLVAHVVKKYYAATGGTEDMVSIGTIGLIKAVDTFDPARSAKFAGYASRCIENATLTLARFQMENWAARKQSTAENPFGTVSPPSASGSTSCAASRAARPCTRRFTSIPSRSSHRAAYWTPSSSTGNTNAMRTLIVSPTASAGAATSAA